MNSDQEAQGPGEVEKKLTLKLMDVHAPGLVSFLNNLPARTEAAFIRGLIYQWLLENRDAEDFEQRLLAVLDGPGGRTMTTTFAAQQSRPSQALRPRKPRAPRPPAAPAPAPRPAALSNQAQIVMPGTVTSRHQVSGAEHTAPAGVVATPAIVSPEPIAPAPVLTTVAAPPAEPANNDQNELDADTLAALEDLGEMF